MKRTLVLTDEYQNEPSQFSRVYAVGRGVQDLKSGDIVFSQRYPASAWEIPIEYANGKKLVSVKYEEILAKICVS